MTINRYTLLYKYIKPQLGSYNHPTNTKNYSAFILFLLKSKNALTF